MKRIFLLIPVLFLIYGNSLVAQNDDSVSLKHKYNAHQYLHEGGRFLTQPLRWKAINWVSLALVAGGTYGIYTQDQKLYNVALKNPGHSKSPVLFVGKQWGGFFFPPALTLTLYIHGLVRNNSTTKRIGFELLEAISYSELVSFPIKAIAGRSRPMFNHGANAFHPFTAFNSPRNSFPAGHVDDAFAVSTVLAMNFRSPVLKVLAYVPAAVCVTERIYNGLHWPSDCFFGAALGTFAGIYFAKQHKNKETKVQVSSIYPLMLSF